MRKPWRLTPAAEESLIDIALWTISTFGPTQADVYEGELIGRCQAIADGRAASRDCSILLVDGEGGAADLRFTRAGEHFVIFIEEPDEIVIVEFLHSRSDLPARIAAIEAMLGP